jgi:hypothetical protein
VAKALKEKPKFSAFWRAYTIVVCLVLLAIAGGTRYFYLFLEDYEATLPQYVMDSFIANLSGDIGAYDYLITSVSEFESDDDAREAFHALLSGGGLEYEKKLVPNGEDAPVYILRSNGEYVGAVSLIALPEPSKFGFSEFAIEKITDLYLPNIAITASLPAGYTLHVNGRELGADFIIKETPFEHDQFALNDEGALLYTYQVAGLTKEPRAVATDKSGNAVDLYLGEDLADLGATVLFSGIEITAPTGFSVIVDGVEITNGKWSKETLILEELANYPADYVPEVPSLTAYEVTGLTETPKVEVFNFRGDEVAGEALGNHYRYDFTFSGDDLTAYEDIVLPIARMYCNYIADSPKATKARMYRYLLPDTPSYSTLQPRRLMRSFYTDHVAWEFDNEEISELALYSPSLFQCRIKLDFTIIQASGSRFTTDIDMVGLFVKVEGKWYLLDFWMAG